MPEIIKFTRWKIGDRVRVVEKLQEIRPSWKLSGAVLNLTSFRFNVEVAFDGCKPMYCTCFAEDELEPEDAIHITIFN